MIWQILALSILLGFIIGFLVGGFIQWNEHQPILKKNRRELMDAYREQDRLRSIIYTMENSLTIRHAKGK